MKNFLLTLVLIVVVLVVIEGSSFVAYRIIENKNFSFSELQQEKIAITNEKENEKIKNSFLQLPAIIHPYIGSVYNADFSTKSPAHMGMDINEFGYYDDGKTLYDADPKRFIVGVFGGSVAWWMSSVGEEKLKGELAKISEVNEKEIIIVRLASGAKKQPQQLTTLSYLLSLGAHFDLIINLDGFNEIAIPPTHLLPKQANPVYPAYWPDMLSKFAESSEKELIGKIYNYKTQRKEFARFSTLPIVRDSITASLLWKLYDKHLEAEISKAVIEQKESLRTDKAPAVLRGPNLNFGNGKTLFKNLAKVWSRSSLAMHDLAKARGIKYFHFLQPNQYVPNSKPMSDYEKSIALNDKLYWKKNVLAGYPHLIEEGKQLKDKGVKYFDLTMLFKDIEIQLYGDTCCHLSAGGNAVFSEKIGKLIRENY